MRFRAIAFAGLIGTALLGLLGCGTKAPFGQVLAEVGGQRITTDDFEYALANLPDQYRVLAESYKGKRNILTNLVKKDLLVVEAERRGYGSEAAVKKQVQEVLAERREYLNRQMEELKKRQRLLDRQVYENVLLSELNRRLRQDGLAGVTVAPPEIEAYYQDYARKLKILNPAATVPSLDSVKPQIKAILVEDQLLKQLEGKSTIVVKEELFKQLYGDEKAAPIVPDHPSR